MNCIKCDTSFEGNFCPNCGHKVRNERYSLKKVANDTIESLDIHRGFFKTSYLLMVRPGTELRQYIDGKSVLYNPVKLFIILGTLCTLITFRLLIFSEAGDPFSFLGLPNQNGYTVFSGKYFSLTNMFGVPVFALFTWLVYWKEGINFSESLILNIYIAAGQYLIILFFFPLLVFFKNDAAYFSYGFVNMAYNLIILIRFFDLSWLRGISKSLLVLLLSTVGAFFLNYMIFRITPQPVLDSLELL